MLSLNPIGYIKTPYERLEDCPNDVEAEGADCEVIQNQEFARGQEGLRVGHCNFLLRARAAEKSLRQHWSTCGHAAVRPAILATRGEILRVNSLDADEVHIRCFHMNHGFLRKLNA